MAQPASSPGYVLERSRWLSSGDVATSAGFRLTFSIGQKGPVEASAAWPFVLQSGFWSFAGAGPIAIVLRVARNETEPQHCDLYWSGNEPPYEIYAGACTSVFDSYVDASSANSLLNLVPPPGVLVCFNVVSTRPERLPDAKEVDP